ncbi:MAG: hypothetical protein ABI175_11710 [Polyangiales bacterium]
MRFFLFVFGIVLGVAGTLAYTMFVVHPATTPIAEALPANPPMTVTLGESFLTAVVRRGALDTQGLAVPGNALRAELGDGTIIVHAAVEVVGQSTEGTITLRPTLNVGRLGIAVVETNLGSVQIPAMDHMLETQINARVQSLMAGLPVTITGVSVERGRGLILTCEVDLQRLEQKGLTVR